MNMRIPQSYDLRVHGPFACFTLPYGPERVSSLAPSHDAAESILRSIYGQWEMRWVIHEVRFLNKPKKFTTTVNELKSLAFTPKRGPIMIEEERTQRSTTILCEVDYHFKASIVPSGRGAHEANLTKFNSMFLRRLQKGKQWTQTYLGQREYTGYVEELECIPPPVDFNADLGLHYYGYDFDTKTPYFTPLQIVEGVLKFPTWSEVLKHGMKGVATK